MSGYYGGQVDNLLMRFTDLILTLPLLLSSWLPRSTSDMETRRAWASSWRSSSGPARPDRARTLPVAAGEGVRRGRESGRRKRPAHHRPPHPPELLGPIIVTLTLLVALAILTESALSFLGLRHPAAEARAGQADRRGPDRGLHALVARDLPGLTIVLIALGVNFIGDGLRDALDPTQRRTRAR